jgi:hypothetical protein
MKTPSPDPDFDARTFTVEATGTDKNYCYSLFGNQALSLEDVSLKLTYNGPGKAATGAISADLDFAGIDLDVRITLSKAAESFSVISQLADPISLLKVVESLSGKKVAAPPGLAKTRIKSMGMSIAVDDRSGDDIRQLSADENGAHRRPVRRGLAVVTRQRTSNPRRSP